MWLIMFILYKETLEQLPLPSQRWFKRAKLSISLRKRTRLYNHHALVCGNNGFMVAEVGESKFPETSCARSK